MTPQASIDRKCMTCDFYSTGNTAAHGTCHIDPPGRVGRGFPIVAAVDWCAKWMPEAAQAPDPRDVKIDELRARIVLLICRGLWQRILNSCPWRRE